MNLRFEIFHDAKNKLAKFVRLTKIFSISITFNYKQTFYITMFCLEVFDDKSLPNITLFYIIGAYDNILSRGGQFNENNEFKLN